MSNINIVNVPFLCAGVGRGGKGWERVERVGRGGKGWEGVGRGGKGWERVGRGGKGDVSACHYHRAKKNKLFRSTNKAHGKLTGVNLVYTNSVIIGYEPVDITLHPQKCQGWVHIFS